MFLGVCLHVTPRSGNRTRLCFREGDGPTAAITKRQDWFWAFNNVFERNDISEHEIVVYLFLSRCADSERRSFPSNATIAEKCRISKSTAKRALLGLVEKGLVSKTPRLAAAGDWSSNIFELHNPGEPEGGVTENPPPPRETPPVGSHRPHHSEVLPIHEVQEAAAAIQERQPGAAAADQGDPDVELAVDLEAPALLGVHVPTVVARRWARRFGREAVITAATIVRARNPDNPLAALEVALRENWAAERRGPPRNRQPPGMSTAPATVAAPRPRKYEALIRG